MLTIFYNRPDQTEKILRDCGLLPKEDLDELENVQLTNDFFGKIKFIEFIAFFFSWVGIGTAIVEYELRYVFQNKGELTDKKEV